MTENSNESVIDASDKFDRNQHENEKENIGLILDAHQSPIWRWLKLNMKDSTMPGRTDPKQIRLITKTSPYRTIMLFNTIP